jgi:hypothetical protein
VDLSNQAGLVRIENRVRTFWGELAGGFQEPLSTRTEEETGGNAGDEKIIWKSGKQERQHRGEKVVQSGKETLNGLWEGKAK